ncbi:T9SS type A sorting domain-containing protein [Chryseobacterium shigense]|uniref:Leucine-rich repeat (LRR) protein n=1 Tax=Chryseobacterium shigense TaxID=297244 RepID=A0A841NDX2_9FLAO|nr:T9SS type A sorting domain-containing protein [Chryseobacterium shigense]MBB6369105.1 Leucine-rich repeat (LRR) protein [Chryseobacterium shigense]
MKKLYFFVLFLAHLSVIAQIVNIPDLQFKANLLSGSATNHITQDLAGNWILMDLNNDGEIQVSEAANIRNITIYSSNGSPFQISSIEGVKSFVNLEYLDVSDSPNILSVDISGMPKIKLVSFDNNTNMSSANFTGCPVLENISVKNAHIVNLDISNLPKMNILTCTGGKVQTINFAGSSTMKYLLCSDNEISSIDVSSLTDLYRFHISSNLLTSLNVSNLTKLEDLVCSANQLTSLVLQNTPKLKSLEASYNNLSTLNLNQSPVLNYLRIINNQFTSIDLSGVPLLQTLFLNNNQLTSLNISNNTILNSFNAPNNNLQSIFMKNGRLTSGLYQNNPNLSYICCDESEINQTIANNTSFGYNNVTVNSYCSFTPGGTFYTIKGNTKYDLNGNGCDPADLNKTFQKFNIAGGGTTGSIIGDQSGNYSVPVQAGSHTVVPILENPVYFNISPASFTANFPAQASPLTQNFCIAANGSHPDLEIVIIPLDSAVPGFNSDYKIVFKNKGTTMQSGTVIFSYNDNIMDFLNASVTPNSQSTGSLSWNFSNLLPFETREIKAKFELNTPTDTPPVNDGDILHYTAQINGAADDTPADNLFTLNQTVVNSLDPNDKTCLEGTMISQTQVGDFVHYLIRFENTGTANARNIVVKDNIDISKFDISTLTPLNGSHHFVTRISGTNTAEFIFENIQLPFDDDHNDGYISFKIKTKTSLATGDAFSNTANIYFDYNAPIITNTYTTTVRGTLAAAEAKPQENITIYPNPVQDILYIRSGEKIIKTEIYDASGRILNAKGVNGNSVNVSELAKGSYIITLFTKDKTVVRKFIKN